VSWTQGLTLLHRDRDFECIAAVTGQALQRYGPAAGQ
jgi:predicted nucleic acid-binding protein